MSAGSRERPRRAGDLSGRIGDALLQVFRLDLIGLGQHDLVGHGRLVQGFEHPFVDGLDAVAGIDEQVDAREAGATAQVIVDQLRPGLHLFLPDGRIAIAGHVDQMEPPAADLEEVELWVRPGVWEVRARVFRPVRALTRLDLPTFERPAKAISTGPIGGRFFREFAAHMKSASPANSLRPISRKGSGSTSVSDMGLL